MQCLEWTRYEIRCAVKQRDEGARGRREDKFLEEFIAQYELLYNVQDAMRCRIRDIFVHGIVED